MNLPYKKLNLHVNKLYLPCKQIVFAVYNDNVCIFKS